jgi:hypothetical protein
MQPPDFGGVAESASFRMPVVEELNCIVEKELAALPHQEVQL